MSALARLAAEIRSCQVCAPHLAHEPRPVLRVNAAARILIAGQAPGRLVHETGLPWNDPSGDRLRSWMGLDRDVFYDETRIAVAAMGFCFPGQDPGGADLPPRPECAPLWRARLLSLLPEIRLTLVIGRYAQTYHLGSQARRRGVGGVVRDWRSLPHDVIALPHPSWRNNHWLQRNPWFEAEVAPYLRARVAGVLAAP